MIITSQRICGNVQQSLSNNFHLVFSVMNPYLVFFFAQPVSEFFFVSVAFRAEHASTLQC